jgi:DNA-binding transcriptional MerR regulator
VSMKGRGPAFSASNGSLPSKLYFRIGEVAGLVGVEPHVLRYWEREFRAIRPTKSAKGQRVYSRRDVENLLRVRALLYEEGFTIAGAKKKLGRSDDTSEAPESEPRASGVTEVSVAPVTEVGPLSEPSPMSGTDLRDDRTSGARASLLGLRAELEELLASLDEG